MPFERRPLICFNKPYGVLSQFRPEGRWRGLKDFIDIPNVYAAGRLDADSEGLLLLTDDGQAQARIAEPRFVIKPTGVPPSEMPMGVMPKEFMRAEALPIYPHAPTDPKSQHTKFDAKKAVSVYGEGGREGGAVRGSAVVVRQGQRL